VRMLEEQQVVVAVVDQGPLQRPGVAVRDPAEPADPEGRVARRAGAGQRTSACQSRVSMISRMRWRKAAA
jgi:hypothetical protein